MNKYASGYNLIQVLAFLGWLIIAISVIGGFIVFTGSSSDTAWVGFVIAIGGGFQGLMLLGVGAIGTAILDGSQSQQRMEQSFEKLLAVLAGKADLRTELLQAATNSEESSPFGDSNVRQRAIVDSGMVVHRGYIAFYSDGRYIVCGRYFNSADEARQEIDEILNNGKEYKLELHKYEDPTAHK